MWRRYHRAKSGGHVENAERRIVAALEDLLFRSKINETAENLEGVEASFPRSPKKLMETIRSSPPDLLVLDLNSERFEPLKILAEMNSDAELANIPTVGFLSHVQKDLAVAAKEYGCGKVMARSAFTQKLPEVLAGGKAEVEDVE
jgi:PleD family two-component response regulator